MCMYCARVCINKGQVGEADLVAVGSSEKGGSPAVSVSEVKEAALLA